MGRLMGISLKWLLEATPIVLIIIAASGLLTLSSLDEFRSNAHSAREGGEVAPPTTPITGVIPEEELSRVVPSGTKEVTYNESGENVTVEVPTGSGKAFSGIVNGALLIGVGAVSGFGFYILLKRGRRKALVMIFSLLFLFIISLGVLLDTHLLMQGAGIWKDEWFTPLTLLSVLLALPLTSAIVFFPRYRPVALLLMSVILGVFLAYVLPFYVVLPLAVAAALWDYRAARKGVIKDIVELESSSRFSESNSPRKAASVKKRGNQRSVRPPGIRRKTTKRLPDFTEMGLYDAGDWQIGFGDLVIYSALGASLVRHYFVIMPAMGITNLADGLLLAMVLTLSLAVVCLAGLIRTTYYLEEGEIFPALPFPVGGMTLFYIVYTIFMETFSLVYVGSTFPLL